MKELNYDVVVIGAGNGGLIASLRLAKANKRVLLVEKHVLPGGFASSFIRGRFEFEASLHELCDLGNSDNQGNLYILFKELDVLDKMSFVDVPEAFRVISLDTKEDYTMPFGIDEFINKMEEYVPGSRKSMTLFFEYAKEIREAMAYLSSSKGNPDTKVLINKYPRFLQVASKTVSKVLKSLKMPIKAQRILNTYWTYLGAPEAKLSFVHYAIMVYQYISLKAQIPTKRSNEMSMILSEEFKSSGGTIFYGREVKEILLEEDEVVGVILDNDIKINTNHVISNVSPHIVYGNLIKEDDIPIEAIQLTNSRRLSARGFSLFLGLNKSKEELGLNNYSYFIYNSLDSNQEFYNMRSMENYSQVVVCLNNALPECSPKGTTILYFTSLYFSNCFDGVRKEDNYFDLKDGLALKYIKNFEKATNTSILPYIEEIEVATPITYAHYTNAPDGAIYGYYTADNDSMLSRLMSMYDEDYIKGLKFCGGHSVRSSGYSSSYLSGDIAAKLTLSDMSKDGDSNEA